MWYPFGCFVCGKNNMGALYGECVDPNCEHFEKGYSPILCADCWRKCWKLGIIVVTDPGMQVDEFHTEGAKYEFTVCPSKELFTAVKLMGMERIS